MVGRVIENHRSVQNTGGGTTFVCDIESIGYADCEADRWSYCPACGRLLDDTNPAPLVEALAAIEHEQWVHWSKEIAEDESISLSRVYRWQENWADYDELDEGMKEHDRQWARKVIDLLERRGIIAGVDDAEGVI